MVNFVSKLFGSAQLLHPDPLVYLVAFNACEFDNSYLYVFVFNVQLFLKLFGVLSEVTFYRNQELFYVLNLVPNKHLDGDGYASFSGFVKFSVGIVSMCMCK